MLPFEDSSLIEPAFTLRWTAPIKRMAQVAGKEECTRAMLVRFVAPFLPIEFIHEQASVTPSFVTMHCRMVSSDFKARTQQQHIRVGARCRSDSASEARRVAIHYGKDQSAAWRLSLSTVKEWEMMRTLAMRAMYASWFCLLIVMFAATSKHINRLDTTLCSQCANICCLDQIRRQWSCCHL